MHYLVKNSRIGCSVLQDHTPQLFLLLSNRSSYCNRVGALTKFMVIIIIHRHLHQNNQVAQMNQKSDHIQVHQSKFINLKNIINLRRIKKDLAVLKRPHSRTSMTIPRRWHHHKRRTWSLSFSNDLHFIVFITSLCCLLSCSLNFSCNMSKSNITL